jgi:hypothetical protein
MPISLQYIMPEELDLLGGDASGNVDVRLTAQRVYMCQQHVQLLGSLKKEDLKSQVGKFFRQTYVDFKLSVSLPELVILYLFKIVIILFIILVTKVI